MKVEEINKYIIEEMELTEERGDNVTNMCEKPTPLGVGWIAQKYKTMCM